MSVLGLARPELLELAGYSSARMEASGGRVLLNANESPWSPLADGSDLNRYPEPQPADLLERLAEGVWQVPADLPKQGRQYDAQRAGGVVVELKSHLPIERQARVIGATWLDQQLIGGGEGLGELGFGGDVRQVLQQRADFLAEQGLAERRGQRVILARNLLATLRNRDLAQAAQNIAAETGLEHRAVGDGEREHAAQRRCGDRPAAP